MKRRSTTSRRRRVAAAAAVLALNLMIMTHAGPAAADADKTRPAAERAVVSGQARFEVLSPTLIRTEYAGDGKFLDAATFNAIGRDSFNRTNFKTRTTDGWLTITTDAVTLRYKVGSGPFNPTNLVVTRQASGNTVTAAPWTGAPVCEIGTRCEVESLDLSGATVATDHKSYTGTGFAAGFANDGDSVTFATTVQTAGAYDFDVRYANSTGGDGLNTVRTMSVAVDGGAPATVSLPPTGNWDTWAVATASVNLTAGRHTIAFTRAPGNSGHINVDNIALVKPGDPYPGVTPPTASPCGFAKICEAESGALSGGGRLATDHNGYSGKGFAAGLEKAGGAAAYTVTDVPSDGTYALQVRYANYLAGSQPLQSRTMSVTVGDAPASTLTLAPTSSWNAWRTVSTPVKLSKGTNQVTLGCPTATSCNVNLDTVAFTGTTSALLDPHAPLGGYRRALDGVNGGALTSPGLLYQDGWSLLDDTASAVFDQKTRGVTPRKTTDGKPYQDGYVFAYGKDYQRGLQDLATLTGPPKLLPRWAYGVWYSEYYNRTAADFQNTIVPRFRAEKVPLDVLVVDTDFKSPNLWNGWEIDTAKFPDPAAFFAWAHAQGLYTSVNLHPSILASDPQFARAQEIAKGKLKPGGCGGGGKDCYVFDFGDPDQLNAYLSLHDQIRAAGNDLWWLDWCCDQTRSSLAGVTGDAWINQKYADYTSQSLPRGFAFSRAYGSLQAGGYSNPVPVATGPWADKRTTLHFTGDTTSNWQTLAFEVAYTPGESVATGMASVSHDIGGHTGGATSPGSEPGSNKLADDLYARWVQFGTFQPIDRLHSNHGDRLPWQYGAEANKSANKFLNLRENLIPYTYTLAQQSSVTGMPIVRPLYLQYPDQQEAYAQADAEYLYGPDILVAPVTTPGNSATTTVWFPSGSSWTDYFTGRTYAGGTSAQITTDLSTMPVFVRSGGIVTTRTDNVANDQQNPLTAATVTVTEGNPGSSVLYEDDGNSATPAAGTTTEISYDRHKVRIDPVHGTFAGQVTQRTWTVRFTNATAPTVVSVNGKRVSADSWSWDRDAHVLTVTAAKQPVNKALTVSYDTN
ncbi:TIM-barrel domain-containing protein [Dactylosporangium sp. CA-233914]|uniref:TIM-barrel domain-containing protein n=1 Tax=Dactylosporangium sp. CA-233914 TaxID=3239934 RepID=UPI003D8B11B9